MGELIYLDREERLQAASEDIIMLAFWELKNVGYTEQPLEDKVINALEGYPLNEMLADIQRRYYINEPEAIMIMTECNQAVCEQYNVE